MAAMRLLALPDNGHTRLIPNDAISVLPLRFVSVGAAVQLTDTAPETTAPRGELIAVNGTPLSQIEDAAGKFLLRERARGNESSDRFFSYGRMLWLDWVFLQKTIRPSIACKTSVGR